MSDPSRLAGVAIAGSLELFATELARQGYTARPLWTQVFDRGLIRSHASATCPVPPGSRGVPEGGQEVEVRHCDAAAPVVRRTVSISS